VNPIPHLDPANAPTLSAALVDEIKDADTILLGLPLYNFGAPSTVHAWVDHLVAPGLSIDAETGEGLLGGVDFIALASRGGGYGPGTPREGWEHAEAWLPHAVSLTGLRPRFITAELTMADVNPAMAELKPLAAESLRRALAAIDELWTADENAA
jgi:FMN-dependent NADH-azoreductase